MAGEEVAGKGFSVQDTGSPIRTRCQTVRMHEQDALKKKLFQEGFEPLSERIGQLKMASADGTFYATDCANTGTMFRMSSSALCPLPSPRHYVQSVPPLGYRLFPSKTARAKSCWPAARKP